MLSEILSQGRALGVVVLACLQDPRKEVVSMRGLFTQTVALRLKTGDETAMVLGDGMARLAPAHRISPIYPGTGWVVEDNGAVDRVRADFWPDDLIRDLARRYPTEERVDLAPSRTDPTRTAGAAEPVVDFSNGTRPARAPRAPRTPRVARARQDAGSAQHGGAA